MEAHKQLRRAWGCPGKPWEVEKPLNTAIHSPFPASGNTWGELGVAGGSRMNHVGCRVCRWNNEC